VELDQNFIIRDFRDRECTVELQAVKVILAVDGPGFGSLWDRHCDDEG